MAYIKTCIECKHCSAYSSEDDVIYYCRHPNVVTVNLINGTTSSMEASKVRYGEHLCGSGGEWWEETLTLKERFVSLFKKIWGVGDDADEPILTVTETINDPFRKKD